MWCAIISVSLFSDESFKNGSTISTSANAITEGSNGASWSRVGDFENSAAQNSVGLKTESKVNNNSSNVHQMSSNSAGRTYSHLRSSVLSHVGQFFCNRGAKIEEPRTPENSPILEAPTESCHLEQKTATSPVGYSNYLPSSDVRTDSEVDSDQEMVIDYNSGSETPNSPGLSAPSNFGFYNKKEPKDQDLGATASTSENTSQGVDTAESTSRSSPNPKPSGFYSANTNSSDAPSTSK